MIESIEKIIGYSFSDKSILRQALTHSSVGEIASNGARLDYERLEFIGDGMLNAMIGASLFQRVQNGREGELTKLRAQIVCEESLNRVGRELGVEKYIRLGESEETNSGREKPSVVADVVEAIIGGIFLDSGYDEADAFVKRTFEALINDAIAGKLFRDYKTKLQEEAQRNNWHIEYSSEEEGPDHDKTFYVRLKINNKEKGIGIGKSKKEAEQQAAKNFFEKGI